MPDVVGSVYELAAQQEEALAEFVLARLFTDQPVREVVRGSSDTRQHWQWIARTDRDNQGSRIWLSYGEPIVDETVTLIKQRAEVALADIVPRYATSLEVTVKQVRYDAISIDILIVRTAGDVLSMGFVLEQGVTGA